MAMTKAIIMYQAIAMEVHLQHLENMIAHLLIQIIIKKLVVGIMIYNFVFVFWKFDNC